MSFGGFSGTRGTTIATSIRHLTRRVSQGRMHESNPIIVSEHDWAPPGHVVAGVTFDEEEGTYKVWLDGCGIDVFYFISRDGIHWERLTLRMFPEFDDGSTNRAILSGSEIQSEDVPTEELEMWSREAGWRYFGHARGIIKDPRDPGPARRYKMALH